MSSPIAITRAMKSGASTDSDARQSVTSRSLPTTTRTRGSGVYVPVHRRGASTSSLLRERRALSETPRGASDAHARSPSGTNCYGKSPSFPHTRFALREFESTDLPMFVQTPSLRRSYPLQRPPFPISINHVFIHSPNFWASHHRPQSASLHSNVPSSTPTSPS